MKFALVVFSVAIAVACASPFTCTKEDWENFKESNNKSYKGEEDQHRREIFCDSVQRVNEHNQMYEAGELAYSLGITEFADLTQEEFAKLHGKRRKKIVQRDEEDEEE